MNIRANTGPKTVTRIIGVHQPPNYKNNYIIIVTIEISYTCTLIAISIKAHGKASCAAKQNKAAKQKGLAMLHEGSIPANARLQLNEKSAYITVKTTSSYWLYMITNSIS